MALSFHCLTMLCEHSSHYYVRYHFVWFMTVKHDGFVINTQQAECCILSPIIYCSYVTLSHLTSKAQTVVDNSCITASSAT